MREVLRVFLVAMFVASAGAAVPPALMNHQGRIAVDGVNFEGTGYFKFALVDGSGGETFWTSDGTASGEPVSAVGIGVDGGHYAVLLGEAPMPALPVQRFADEPDVRLRVWFSGEEAGPYLLLAPDRRVTPTGYAFVAAVAGSVAPGYDRGGGSELEIVSAGAGGGEALTVSGVFAERFGSVPDVELGVGWAVTASDESGFSAEAEFVALTLDADGTTGADASLAVIGGRPAIAYRDEGEGDLMFHRATDRSGTRWLESSIVRVAGAGASDVGEYASLAEVGGRPAIAYYDLSEGDLKYVRADDVAGTSWPEPVTVDGDGANVGRYVSLAVVGGVPAIGYTAPNAGELRYAWATDGEGGAWETVVIEGAAGDYRGYCSLADVGGKPGIATYDMTAGVLRYVFLSGSDLGSPGDWDGREIDVSGAGGAEPSLAVIGGRPAVCYESATGGLKFVRGSDATGSSWGAPVVVVASGRQGALAEIGGRPAVSFYDPTGDLAFAWAGDVDGVSWPSGQVVVVDGGGADVGVGSSLTEVDGLPAMAYRDESGLDLKYASLPGAAWVASRGGAEPILASGVEAGGVTAGMLAEEVGVWGRAGDDLFLGTGRVGIGRLPAGNALEVEGRASKTVAGSWLANSDRRIKDGIRELEGALERIEAVRLVDFEYSAAYRERHPSIELGRRYPNVVAQEFAEVFPGFVSSSGEPVPGAESGEILQVDTYPLVIYGAAAIQELAEENRELRDRVGRLEAALEQLLGGVDRPVNAGELE